ncbi:signal peptidase 22 kDa subunit [Neocallimastix californiae]|jgi:signal peptidase complex subunit 3|uniref:Signal peptidase subunit 3 n=1 Tax=Neocallimastix californiae TaxID=1754190 RepID=A0A1Y2EHI0_9FUNG|nr:signal peptidase 22 kDa subunit [Neocallimastix californiae]|eukprot:ORY70726.1 signal peptidase 22 kDa subunit [Neocallimastix californiae]
MFSFYNRGSTFLNFLCTVLPVLLLLLACTSPLLLNRADPIVKINVRNVHMKRYSSSSTPSNKKESTMFKLYRYHYPYRYPPKGDIALIDFDINADLTSVFNWNVKELFVYLVYEFQTPKQDFNQVVVWDDIILNKQDAHIKGKNVESEYLVTAFDNNLRGVQGNLTLYWDIIPNTGLLFQKSKGSLTVPLQKTEKI